MMKTIMLGEDMRCEWCERLTNRALLHDEWTPNFQPACYQHGYVSAGWTPTRAELATEHASIARFVMGIHQFMGKAKVIKVVEESAVPGYVDADMDDSIERHGFPDIVWYVRYSRAGKKRKYGYAVW